MAVSPSVSMRATLTLHWWVLRVRAIWRSRPGTSWATTCRMMEWVEDSESNWGAWRPAPLLLLSSQFADDGDGGGGADAVGAGFEEGADLGEGADAAGGFDAGTGAGYAAEQGHVGRGCAGGGEAGGGLEEVGAGLDGDLGGAEFFSDCEQGGFKNHLEQGAVVMGDGGDGVDSVVYGVMVAAFELADGDDHVQLARAQAGDGGGFLAERGDQRGAEGKADDGAHGDAGSGEDSDRGGNPDRVDHGTGKAVADGLVAEAFDLVAGGAGLEQGVVNDGGQRLPARQHMRGEGGGIEAAEIGR